MNQSRSLRYRKLALQEPDKENAQLLQLLADEGDTVRQGQPLARLDVAMAAAQTSAAQASVAEAASNAQTVAVRLGGDVQDHDALEVGQTLAADAPPHADDVVVHATARDVLAQPADHQHAAEGARRPVGADA